MSSPSPLVFHFNGIHCQWLVYSNYSQFRDVNDVFNVLLLKSCQVRSGWLHPRNWQHLQILQTAETHLTHCPPQDCLPVGNPEVGNIRCYLFQFEKTKKRTRQSLDTHPNYHALQKLSLQSTDLIILLLAILRSNHALYWKKYLLFQM